MTSDHAQGGATIHPVSFKIFVNSRKKDVANDVLTYDDVVRLAFENPQTGPDAIYSIVYRDAGDPKSGILAPNGTVTIKNGTRFDVTPTNKS